MGQWEALGKTRGVRARRLRHGDPCVLLILASPRCIAVGFCFREQHLVETQEQRKRAALRGG